MDTRADDSVPFPPSAGASGHHPFRRLGAEVAAVRAMGVGSGVSVRELALGLGVPVEEVERTWRGIEPLSIGARVRLATLIRERIIALSALEKTLRSPVLTLEAGGATGDEDAQESGRGARRPGRSEADRPG